MQIFKELFRCKTLNIRALYQHLFLGTSNWTPYLFFLKRHLNKKLFAVITFCMVVGRWSLFSILHFPVFHSRVHASVPQHKPFAVVGRIVFECSFETHAVFLVRVGSFL